MKVIDLLNKIANGEEVPKKIKFGNNFFTYNEENDFRKGNSDVCLFEDYFACYLKDNLNQEVEIIEEDKEIGKWNYDKDCTDEWNFGEIKEKLDELVEAVNELKKGK